MLNWLRFFWQTIVAEWRWMWRTPNLMLVLVAIPVLYPLLVSSLYRRDQVVERPTLVVDDDNSSHSRKLTQWLDATQEVQIVGRPPNVEQGWAELRKRSAEMLVYIPSDYSVDIKRGRQAHIKVWINSSNMLTYGAAYSGVTAVVGQLNEELGDRFFLGLGMGRDAASARTGQILRIDRWAFHPTASYGNFLVPGVLLVVVQQVVLVGLALATGSRQERGDDWRKGKYPGAVLWARAMAQSLFHLLGIAFIILGVFPWFGWAVRSQASMAVLFLAVIAATIPMAVMAASLVRDRFAAFQSLMFLSAPLFLMSGFSWPLDQMPDVVRWAASTVPVTPALKALRVLSMKSGELSAVRGELEWMAVCTGIWFVIAIVFTNRQGLATMFARVWDRLTKPRSLRKRA